MGFCLFNNAAIAARHAQKRHGIERVAIVDFDVHHGNGTQDIFWSDPTVMYCSTHQMPLYPGTGAKDERGEHDTIVNAPLRPGDGGEEFREAFETVILPRLREFQPDLLVISAGFDAHMRDPARQSQFAGSRFRLGDPQAHGDRRREREAAASSRCWKAAMTSTACLLRRRPCRRADAGVNLKLSYPRKRVSGMQRHTTSSLS